MTITGAELAKMEEVDKTAIEAEWSFKDWRNGDPVQICKQYEGADWVGVAFIAGAHGTSLDAYTLVSAVKDRRKLIAEVRRLQATLSEIEHSAKSCTHARGGRCWCCEQNLEEINE